MEHEILQFKNVLASIFWHLYTNLPVFLNLSD
jgi:hypothetical protein